MSWKRGERDIDTIMSINLNLRERNDTTVAFLKKAGFYEPSKQKTNSNDDNFRSIYKLHIISIIADT